MSCLSGRKSFFWKTSQDGLDMKSIKETLPSLEVESTGQTTPKVSLASVQSLLHGLLHLKVVSILLWVELQ